MASTVPNGIIFYGYAYSPYARKVKSYLALRNIDYAECVQPFIMPRPDLSALGVNYRRIPVMAIGRDIYIDTRAIIRKLEELFPASKEHPPLTTPQSEGVALLLNNFIGNYGVFGKAVGLLTPESGAMQDPNFRKDRAEFFGEAFFKGGWRDVKKESIVHMRHVFAVYESLLQDGRKWIAGTQELSSADSESQWILDWYLKDLQAPKEYFNDTEFPKTFAWIMRYRAALKAALQKAKKPQKVGGEEAAKFITDAEYTDRNPTVDPNDPLQLSKGTFVALFPTDGGGPGHHDRGQLVKATREEVAIEVKASNGKDVRIHAPRWNFRVQEVKDKSKL